MLSLDPGGPGSLPVIGLVVLLAAVGGALLAPRRSVVPGLAITVLGVVAAGIVGSVALPPLSGGDPRPGWTGPALAFAACGTLWTLLALVAEARVTPLGTLVTGRTGPKHRPAPRRRGDSEIDLGPDGVLTRVGGGTRSAATRIGTVLGSRLRTRRAAEGTGGRRARGAAVPVTAAVALALAVSAVLLASGGPLAARPAPTLDPTLAAKLAGAGATVADVGLTPLTDGPGYALDADRTRRTGPDLPRYGDDDLAPVGAAPARLTRDVTALLSGDPATVQAGAAELATAGTGGRRAARPGGRRPCPGGRVAAALRRAADQRRAPGPDDRSPGCRGGHPRAAGLRRRHRRQGRPAARVGDHPAARDAADGGRADLLRARTGGSWSSPRSGSRAGPPRSAGRPPRSCPAWGHLVGVAVPSAGGPVVVARDDTLRSLLLLGELALVLFTALSALPSRRRLD